MTSRSRIVTSMTLAVLLIMAAYGIALAHRMSQSWPKSSGVTLVADHDHWFTTNDGHMFSDSKVTSPYGAMMTLYTDNRPQDRCRNANGSWQTWYMYEFENISAYASYVQLNDTHGPFQNCVYGHEYLWESLHGYTGYGINENHTLTDGPY